MLFIGVRFNGAEPRTRAVIAVLPFRATAAKALRPAECAAWRGGFARTAVLQRRFLTLSRG